MTDRDAETADDLTVAYLQGRADGVQAERERCADICEDEAMHFAQHGAEYAFTAAYLLTLAARIRQGD